MRGGGGEMEMETTEARKSTSWLNFRAPALSSRTEKPIAQLSTTGHCPVLARNEFVSFEYNTNSAGGRGSANHIFITHPQPAHLGGGGGLATFLHRVDDLF